MKTTIKILIASASLLLTLTGAAHAERIPVHVKCTGDDSIGQRFCYELKEKLSASQQFMLNTDANSFGWYINIISMDDTFAGYPNTNLCSALSVVFGWQAPNTLPLFYTHEVLITGTHRVNEQSEGVVADLSQYVDELRNASKSSR